MKILKVRFDDGQDLLAAYDLTFAHGGFFVPTRRLMQVGEQVVLAVQVGPRQTPTLMRATVAWSRRGKHKEHVRAGVAVELLASERVKRDFLLNLARGDGGAFTRKHPRVPVDVPTSVTTEAGPAVAAHMRDIGRGGALIVGAELERMGTSNALPGRDVILSLAPPGADIPSSITARVAWVGRDNAAPAIGVSWRMRDTGGSRRVRELVRRIEAAA